MACDCVVLAVAFWLAVKFVPVLLEQLAPGGMLHSAWIDSFLSLGNTDGKLTLTPAEFIWVFVVMCPATVVCYELLGGYRPAREQQLRPLIFSSLVAPVAGVGVLTVVLFTLKHPGYSRLVVFSFALFSAVLLAAGRWAAVLIYRERLRKGYLVKEVALIGSAWMLQEIAATIRHQARQEYNIIGYFGLPADQPAPLGAEAEVPCLGAVDQVGEALIHMPIHDIVIGLPAEGTPWLESILHACDYFRVTTYIIPEALFRAEFKDIRPVTVDSLLVCPLVKLDPVYVDSEGFFLKRVLDIFVSSILLLLLSPLMLLIAIAIKLTTPRLTVFYPWKVIGYRGRRFTGYKFTTMDADVDPTAAQRELMSHNEMTGPVFKISNDPRVTPLGRFLRKYSLNELPQLWSVLKGDMSLVGPRPAGPHELERYDLWHKRKLSVLPGITCFWQVRGRNKISNFDDWVRMDLEYIENWSLWLDCKLIIRTAWVVLAGTGS